ncbi:MAG: 30S ribosomal protein S7 [Elusimicrobia bacterium]|jgi:small subunit ribosomal protein S7|nr:30S ribosomal protein S7 [Elusimicrobiota bacterium]
MNTDNNYQKYNDKEFTHKEIMDRLIKKVMWAGKKSLAAKICSEALNMSGEKLNVSPEEALDKALENVGPLVEVKSKRVGGATYQVPVEVTPLRKLQLSIRWIVDFARTRKGMDMSRALAGEIVQSAKGEGAAVKKKEDIHRMAEANKAFAHYSW